VSQKSAPDELDTSRMPLWEHLDDLRKTLFRCLLIVLLGFAAVYSFADKIVLFLEQPLLNVLPDGEKYLYFTGIADKFFIYLKISFYVSVAVTSPLLLHQIWGFVAPALYKNERKVIGPLLFFATISFVAGLAFAYYIVLPTGYKFLIEYGPKTERPIITLTDYFSLTLQLMIALGVVFELPVVLLILGRLGVIQATLLSKIRPHAYIALSVLAAFITPTPDAFTMLLVLVPLCLLYELSVILVRLTAKNDSI
jgi:sec-independent protein translocase protein TatC